MPRLVAWMLVALAGSAVAAQDEVAKAQVTYVTTSSVYLAAGRDDGLQIGQRLVLRRGDEVVATVEVTDLSAHRASCRIVERISEPAVGDEVRFQAAPPSAAGLPGTPEEGAGAPPARRTGRGAVRGRVGLRYLAIDDRTGETGDYAVPAADLRLDAAGLGSGWAFAVDARARRTMRNPPEGPSDEESRTRVYRLAVSHRAAEGAWGFTAGRQYSPALSAVSIFDGLSADYGRQRWSVGLFSGTQPDPVDYGTSSDVREHGAYFQLRGAPEAATRWSLTTGLIGSYQESEVNREYLYVQGQLAGRRWSGYLTQEVDYNRGWKEDAGEDELSPTATFASVHVTVHRTVTLGGGYDNRRSVRLYRDLVTPETDFDDSFRRGIWAGALFEIPARCHLGFDARTSHRESAGDADSFTATFAARQIGGGPIDLRARSTRYTNDRLEGWLHALDVGGAVGRRVHVGLSGGLRDEATRIGPPADRSQPWLGVDAEFGLGQSYYATVSLERTDGDLDEVDQLYILLTWRF